MTDMDWGSPMGPDWSPTWKPLDARLTGETRRVCTELLDRTQRSDVLGEQLEAIAPFLEREGVSGALALAVSLARLLLATERGQAIAATGEPTGPGAGSFRVYSDEAIERAGSDELPLMLAMQHAQQAARRFLQAAHHAERLGPDPTATASVLAYVGPFYEDLDVVALFLLALASACAVEGITTDAPSD